MNKIGYIIADILLLFVLIFTSTQIVVLNRDYFDWHFKTHDIEQRTNFSVEELNIITDHMLKYLMDSEDHLDIEIEGKQVFSNRAVLHMVDVKNIFLRMYIYRNSSFLILTAYIMITLVFKKQIFVNWIMQLKKFFIISSIVISVVVTGILIEFEKAFILFHYLIFNNDLWILANDDTLVNMVPEIFFAETFMLITIIYIIFILLILRLVKLVKMKGSEIM